MLQKHNNNNSKNRKQPLLLSLCTFVINIIMVGCVVYMVDDFFVFYNSICTILLYIHLCYMGCFSMLSSKQAQGFLIKFSRWKQRFFTYSILPKSPHFRTNKRTNRNWPTCTPTDWLTVSFCMHSKTHTTNLVAK